MRRISHRFHGIHRNSCWGYSPTDFTDLHRLFGCVDSPTDFTDLHRLFGCLQGGALVSSAPTELRWCTSCYVGALETSAPPEVSSFCVNLCNLWEAPLCKKFCADPCNLWEALCCCGGKDTSATIFRTLTICVNLCNLWEALLCRRFCEICVFCGRLHSARVSVQIRAICGRLHPGRVKSVGELSQKLSDYEKKRNFALIARR